MAFTYDHPRPALTVDCVVFGLDLEHDALRVMLIERDLEPFAGHWALPGGFVHVDETLDDAARRELAEETGITDVFLEELCTFSALDRDPRERVISVAYYALTSLAPHTIDARTDARRAAWFDVDDVTELPFDHAEILDTALERLRGTLRSQPIGFKLLPRDFTLTQLQRVYEIVLDEALDKRNFRKKILAMELLVEAGKQTGVSNRPATLYRFDQRAYERAMKRGFSFEL